MSRLPVAAFALLVACSSATDGAGPGTDAATTGPDGDKPPGVLAEPAGEAPPLDNDGEVVVAGPRLRRMSVDQLQASVSVVAGDDLGGEPVAWQVIVGGRPVNAFSDAAFGATLGRPDYTTVTGEDDAPSSLYIKFAKDMARDVCEQLVQLDVQRPGQATLWRATPIDGSATPAQIAGNLRYLALRFLGLDGQESTDVVTSLTDLYAAAVADAQSAPASQVPPEARGWAAVCIALFEDPAFHLH